MTTKEAARFPDFFHLNANPCGCYSFNFSEVPKHDYGSGTLYTAADATPVSACDDDEFCCQVCYSAPAPHAFSMTIAGMENLWVTGGHADGDGNGHPGFWYSNGERWYKVTSILDLTVPRILLPRPEKIAGSGLPSSACWFDLELPGFATIDDYGPFSSPPTASPVANYTIDRLARLTMWFDGAAPRIDFVLTGYSGSPHTEPPFSLFLFFAATFQNNQRPGWNYLKGVHCDEFEITYWPGYTGVPTATATFSADCDEGI